MDTATAAAYDALHGPRTPAVCGRPTKSGQPCEATPPRLMTSCRPHATPAELAAAETERARLAAVLTDWDASLAPACHTWPVTDQHRAAAAIAGHPDPFRSGVALLRTWQQGRCAICADPPSVIDHDHTTGRVRGLLCIPCNRAEPCAIGGDFVKYRARSAAAMHGLEVLYVHPIHGSGRVA